VTLSRYLTPRSHHPSRNTFAAHSRRLETCAHLAFPPTPSRSYGALGRLLRLPRLRKKPRGVPQRKFHYAVLQQQSEREVPGRISRDLSCILTVNLPSCQTCEKAEAAATLFQSHRGCGMSISDGEVGCCNQQEPQLDAEENDDIHYIGW
jgi:hypothetical protein